MPRVLIAGCGYVGNALAEALLADGDEVFGVRRDPRRLAAGVRPLAGDLAAPDSLPPPPRDLDLVAFTAGADEATEAAYRRCYLDGLDGLLRWLQRAGAPPRRLLFTSSTGVYGQQDGEQVDEDSPAVPRSFRGEVLLQAERLVAGAGPRAVTLRLGGIYGPGRTRVIELVRSGRARRRPRPHFTNRIHRDDAARAIRHLLRHDAPQPLYLGVDCEPAEEGALYRWLAERLGAPPPPVAAGDAHGARGVGSKRCSNRRLRDSGYVFRYPTFREGYGALLSG